MLDFRERWEAKKKINNRRERKFPIILAILVTLIWFYESGPEKIKYVSYEWYEIQQYGADALHYPD